MGYTGKVKKVRKQIFSSEKIRFGAVGVVNTAVDFTVLFVLAMLFGLPSVIANIGSTSVALTVSYLLNKRAVFKNTDTRRLRQVMMFLIVTLTGLWLVQGVVIALATEVLRSAGIAAAASLLIAKIIASGFSLVWNYLWYSRVVFKEKTHE